MLNLFTFHLHARAENCNQICIHVALQCSRKFGNLQCSSFHVKSSPSTVVYSIPVTSHALVMNYKTIRCRLQYPSTKLAGWLCLSSGILLILFLFTSDMSK